LLGTGATLNGKLLVVAADGTVPPFEGVELRGGAVRVPAQAVAFYVLPEAAHPACL
jgi:hypothetical protein